MADPNFLTHARILPGPMAPLGSNNIKINKDELDPRCHTLLFTRYFLRGFSRRNSPALSNEQIKSWFTSRNYLFLAYTLPSVLNQLHRNFTWYILVDEPFIELLPLEIKPGIAKLI